MKKFFSICLITIIIASVFCSLSVSAKEYVTMSEKVFAISHGGDTSIYAPNSLEAIVALKKLPFDAFSATVRKTSDSKFILFENETTKGFCVDAKGNATDKVISETDYETLASYYLLSSSNKNLNHKTTEKIALLDTVLKETKDELVMIIDAPENLLDEIYSKVNSLGFINNVLFRCREMKNKNLLNWANSKKVVPEIIPSYKGNVIFSATNTYSFTEENKLSLCEFSVKNRYGVIYSKFFADRFDSSKALAPVYSKDLCGQRPDTVLGWENLLKLGYSAIETENAQEFANYINLLDTSTLNLNNLLAKAEKLDLNLYSSNGKNEFTKSINEAKSILQSKTATSSDEINKAIENINIASDELVKTDGKKESFISPMKIFWIIFALALFVSSQIYLHKKTEK